MRTSLWPPVAGMVDMVREAIVVAGAAGNCLAEGGELEVCTGQGEAEAETDVAWMPAR